MLAGMGVGGLFLVAGSTLLASSPAEARVDTPAIEPEMAPDDVAEKKSPNAALPTTMAWAWTAPTSRSLVRNGAAAITGAVVTTGAAATTDAAATSSFRSQ